MALQLRFGPEPSASLILDGMFLMDSASGVSERALADRGLDLLHRDRAGEPAGSVAVFWATERSPAFEDCLGSLPWGQWHREEISWRPERGGREMIDVLYALIR